MLFDSRPGQPRTRRDVAAEIDRLAEILGLDGRSHHAGRPARETWHRAAVRKVALLMVERLPSLPDELRREAIVAASFASASSDPDLLLDLLSNPVVDEVAA